MIFSLILLLSFPLLLTAQSPTNQAYTVSPNSHQSNLKPLKIADELTKNIHTAHPYNPTLNEGIVFEREFYNKNSSYIKLYFKDFDLAPGDYVKIEGKNSGNTIIYAGQGKIIDEQHTMLSNFWTQILFDERVVVQLHVKNPSTHYGFEIEKVAYGYPEAYIQQMLQTKSICGNDDKEQIICYNGTTMYDKARAVCRLVIGGSGLCTGWLLGCDGHVMTNNHCIGSTADANNTDFVFNYETTNCAGTNNAAQQTVASSSTLIKTNGSLDYTLVQLPVNPTATYGYLSLSSVAPIVNDRIYIPQHPGGRRKEIAVVTDQGGNASGFAQVNTITGTGCRYFADTEGGSSGSPVINFNTNLVVAIHNTGGCTNGSYGRSDQLIAAIGTDMPNCAIDSSGSVATPCTNTVNTFPYAESFENTIGLWSNETNDDIDWASISGATPSNGTGPTTANDGSYYAYVEASNPNYPAKSAILNGPCLDFSTLNYPEMIFDYHMFGVNMGSLRLQVSTDGLSWVDLWTKTGDQGNAWLTDTVDLSSYANSTELRVRFNGLTGGGFESDMAVDAVLIQEGTFSCNTINTFPYAESFENTFGLWEQDINDDFDWAITTGGTPSPNTGPLGAVDGNYYTFVEASAPNFPSLVANLVSPCFDLTAVNFPQLSFNYHMFGADMGTLNVEVSIGGGPWTTIWTRNGDLGDVWNTAVIDLGSYSNISDLRVRFNGTTGTGFNSDFAIDAFGIQSDQLNCTNLVSTFPYNESFENTLGLWSQELMDDFDWTLQTGATPSNGTGPTSANDGNYYLFTEASTPNYPAKTSIINSPCFDINGVVNPTVSFDYHLFGTDVGTLSLEARTSSTAWTTLWTLNGNQGDVWTSVILDLSAFANANDLAFRFNGLTDAWSSDMAIDAFSVYSDVCNAVSGTDVRNECGSYTWIDGNIYTSSNNTATDTLFGASSSGCDSIVTLDLTINTPTNGNDVQVACGSYTWIDGNTYTSSNNSASYTINGGAFNGCDSVVALNLTVNTSSNSTDNQTACNSFTWIDGNTYTSSNNSASYTISGGAFNGCDSVVALDLTIIGPTNGSDVQTACNSFTWIDGNTYTSNNNSASYTYNGGASNGCDSIVTLNLSITGAANGTDVQTACNSFTWIDGNTYTSNNNSASYTINGGAFNGCDSVVTLNLSITGPANGSDVQTACNSFTWIDGNTYTSNNNSASYTINGGAFNGCDSVVTLNLSITGPTNGSDVQSACNSFTWIDGNTYTSSNNSASYTINGGAFNGCDSVVTLNLSITGPANGSDVQTACNSFTWIDGNTYTSNNNSASYTINGGAFNGCDSIVTLNLSIDNIDITTSQNGFNLSSNQSGANYQWLDCNNNFAPINGANNQNYTATANGLYAVIVNNGTCTDTSSCVAVVGLNNNLIEQTSVQVMPNPNDGRFKIDFGKLNGLSVRLFNVNGQVLLQKYNIQQQILEINIQKAAAGVYTLEIQQNNELKHIKLVKF